MLCPSCGHENGDRARFCRDCGTDLTRPCPSCGNALEAGSRFCESCGTPVRDSIGETIDSTLLQESRASATPESFSGDRYVVKGLLGEGATKKVHLVNDNVLGRDVAFAIIKTGGAQEADRERMLREAQTMAKLGEHPNIMTIYEFGEEEGHPFMVLPVMAGGSVEDLVRRSEGGKVDIGTVLRLATDISKGLDFAHANGVIHRDLKPGNVWLTAEGAAAIGDFGIAYLPTRTRVTESGLVMGTVAYMAPEQALGGEVSDSSDLYSLGAMLYELVTGRPPFTGHHPVAIIGQHLNAAPVALTRHEPLCPPPVEALVLHLLAKDPADRPDSAAGVLKRLEHISRASSVLRPPPALAEGHTIPLSVLIVEDSEDDALLLLRELKRGGYEPTSERVDTPDAMKAVLDTGTWDIVISDYNMPHFTAPAALKLLQNTGLDLPFIVVSGNISEETAVAAMKSGAHDYIMKGNLARLTPAVERELREAEERRARRRAEHEERRLHQEIEERHNNLEQRVKGLRTQNQQLQKRLSELSAAVESYQPMLEGVQRLAQDASSLVDLANTQTSAVPRDGPGGEQVD